MLFNFFSFDSTNIKQLINILNCTMISKQKLIANIWVWINFTNHLITVSWKAFAKLSNSLLINWVLFYLNTINLK